MPDNVSFQTTVATPPSGTIAATRERSDLAHVACIIATARSATVAVPIGQSATPVTLLAANDDRAGFVIRNEPQDDVADLLVKFGPTAGLDDYTERIKPGQRWERLGGYTGVITGIWTVAGTGKARVTEEVL